MINPDQPIPNMSPAERTLAVKEAFEAKVLILEQWAADGLPEGLDPNAKDFPKLRAKLRKWKGPNGDLRTWVDPKIDQADTGKYPDLTKRYQDAIKTIQDRHSAKGSRLKEMKQENVYLRQQVENLKIQNATLMGENQRLGNHNKRLKSQIKGMGGYAVS